MPVMQDILLFAHFVGLMMGAGGGLGSTIVMRYAYSLPDEQSAVVRGVGPALATASMVGLIVLLVTGVLLLGVKYNLAFAAMPLMFWIKLAFVATLTVATVLIHSTYARIKRGDAEAAARLPRLGPMAGISAMLATLFAVLAFH